MRQAGFCSRTYISEEVSAVQVPDLGDRHVQGIGLRKHECCVLFTTCPPNKVRQRMLIARICGPWASAFQGCMCKSAALGLFGLSFWESCWASFRNACLEGIPSPEISGLLSCRAPDPKPLTTQTRTTVTESEHCKTHYMCAATLEPRAQFTYSGPACSSS